MFDTFPEVCRSYGVPADVRSLLLLRKAIDRELIYTLGDLYTFFKGVLVKDPTHMGPYSQAFYQYFIGIDIKPGERLSDAVARSQAFKDWLDDFIKGDELRSKMEVDELIERFLDEVHTTTYDIKRVIDGEKIFAEDNPDQADADRNGGDDANADRLIDKAADYRFIDLEELRKRMERVLEQQNSKHDGGSHWVGTGGISPYGNSGAAMGGIRVGGSGGGRMAREVMDDPQYFPVDIDARIGDDNIDATLASLKGVIQESNDQYLDIPTTIKQGVAEGGLFLPIELEKTEDKLQVILLIDNGGYSMDYYIKPIQALFKKMKTRYAHDLETYYFHNTIFKYVYEDERRTRRVPLEKILGKDPNYRIFIIGDAAMAPYELHEGSIIAWGRIKEKFKKTVWLNPVSEKHWHITWTTTMLRRVISMFSLTPRGMELAVREMNKKKNVMK
ncbi:MAG: hypothetical protein ACI9FN_000386 [Saprospiraceae bacterium]|jgi:uncharacterized protein with von Willebrand factor type A (vWA) domain